MAAKSKKLFLEGLTFGPMKVIERVEKNDSKNSWWKCICNICNSIKIYRRVDLYPNRISCGCIRAPSGNKAYDFKGYGHISRAHFNKIKDTAKRKKIEFDISIEDMWNLYLKQNKKCSLTKREINFGLSYKSKTKNASLDRIDNCKGYIIENVQWVHKDINYIKYTNSEKELYNICKNIYNTRNNNIKNNLDRQVINLPLSFLNKNKNLAAKRNIQWNLNYKELNDLYIKQKYLCSLSGEFIYFSSPYIQKGTASLDRIDSNKDYTIDNVQWVSKKCNLMKNVFNNEYFIQSCIEIYLNLKEKYDSN